ncbi:hypothetical protein CLOM_g7920 [Closterium sp. NIES-68]|nr:hypothetical protein CLOM_g7920 [Closterium sp. NIES-68]
MASTADSGGPLREYMPDSSRGSQDGANEAARVTNGGAPSTLPSPLTEELGQGAQAPGFTSSEINSSGRPSNGVNGNISRDPSSPSPRNQLTFTTDNRSPTGQASANIPEASSFLALIQAADAQGGGAETITTTPATTSPAADGSRGLNVGSAPAASEGLRDVTISGLHDVTISGADNLNVRRRLFVDSVGSPRGPRRHHGVLSPPVTGGGGGAAGAGAGGGEATRRQAGRRKRLLPSEEERMRAFGESIHWRLEGIETSGKAHELCLDLGSDMRFLKKWLTANNPKTGTSNVEPLSQDPARHLWDIRRHATPTGFKDRSTPGVMPEFPSVPAPGLAGITPGMLPGAYFTGVRDGPSASDPAGRGFSLLQELEAETAAAAGGQQQQRGSMVQAMQEAMEEDAPGGSNPFHWPMGHRPAGYGASSLDYPAHLSGVGYGMGSAAGGTMQGLDFLNFPQLSGRSHRQGAGRGDDPCGMMGASRGLSHRMLMDEGRMLMGQEEAGVEGMGGAGMMGYPQYHHGLEPSPLTRTSSGHIIMPPSHVSMSERAYLQQPSATSFQSLLTAPERTLLEWPDRGLPFDTGPPYGGGGGGGASSAGLTDSMLWTAGLHKDLGGTAKIGGTAGVGGTAMMGSGETPAAGIQAQQQQEGSLEQQGELGGTSRGDGGKLAEAGGGSNGAHAGGARGDGGETRVGMEGSAGEGDGAGAAEGVGGEAALQRSSRLPPWMRKQLEQSGRALGGDPFRVSSPRIASSPFLSSHFSTPLSSPHLPSPSFAPAQTSPFSSPCLSHLPPPACLTSTASPSPSRPALPPSAHTPPWAHIPPWAHLLPPPEPPAPPPSPHTPPSLGAFLPPAPTHLPW